MSNKKRREQEHPSKDRAHDRLNLLFDELKQHPIADQPAFLEPVAAPPGRSSAPAVDSEPSAAEPEPFTAELEPPTTELELPKTHHSPNGQSNSRPPTANIPGYLDENGRIHPTQTILTPAGRESLHKGQIIQQSARPDQPAVLALSLPTHVLDDVTAHQPSPAGAQLASEPDPQVAIADHPRLLLEILDEDPDRQWSEDEMLLVEQVAGQLTLALENAQLFEQTRRRSEEMGLLRQIAVQLADEQRDLNSVLELITQSAMQLLDSDGGGVWLWRPEEDLLELVISHQASGAQHTGRRLRPGEGLSGRAYTSRQTTVIDDYITWSGASQVFHDAPFHAALATPLTWQNAVIGILVVTRDRRGAPYTSAEQRLSELLAGQAASIIQNARLFTATETALAETEAQYNATSDLNTAASYQDVLTILRRYTLLGHSAATHVTIYLDNPTTADDTTGAPQTYTLSPIARWSAADQLSEEKPPSDLEPAADNEHRLPLPVFSTQTTITIEDLQTDPRLTSDTRADLLAFLHSSSSAAPPRAAILTPLTRANQGIGFLIATYRQPMRFLQDDLRRLNALTGQAAITIDSLRLLEETRRRSQELAAINDIISAASRTLDLEQMLSLVLTKVIQTSGFESGLVSVYDEEQRALRLASIQNLPTKLSARLAEVGLNGTLCELVYQRHQLLNLTDLRQLLPPQPPLTNRQGEVINIQALLDQGIYAYLGVPLEARGAVLGTLCLFSRRPQTIAPANTRILQAIGQQIGVAVENASLFEKTQQAVEDMRQLDRMKSQFLANMSHELRTPLNSIIGFSRVILKGIDGPITELQQQDLAAIHNAGQHLLTLINDVLDLSKIEAGKMELAFEDHVDLRALIDSVMSTVKGLVKDKPVELRQQIAPDLPLVRADPTKLRQVLINLFSNAAKFTETGAITLEIHPQTTPEGQPGVYFSVTDTGPGISPADQQKLFQPFSQVDASLTRKTGGTGLGLSISRHLVEMHGGEISLDSELGQGSTFFFTIPVHPDANRTPPNPAGENAQSSPDQPHPTPTAETKPSVKAQDGQTKVQTKAPPLPSQPEVQSSPGAEEQELTADQSPVDLQPPALTDQRLPVTDQSRPRILVLDDQPQVIDLYQQYLSTGGYQLIALTDPKAILERAQRLQPLVILLDPRCTSLLRPGYDGWQALADLKSDPDTAHIPLIVCSMQEKQDQAFQLGANGYLLKPFLASELLDAINTVTA